MLLRVHVQLSSSIRVNSMNLKLLKFFRIAVDNNILFLVELCNVSTLYTVICCVGGRGESDRGYESIAGGGRNGVRTPQVTSPT